MKSLFGFKSVHKVSKKEKSIKPKIIQENIRTKMVWESSRTKLGHDDSGIINN